MSRSIVKALTLCCLLACLGGTLAAQNAAATLKELNALLESSSLPKYVLTLAADGSVVVKNKYGLTVTFNLREIGDITFTQPDAEAVVFLPCRDKKPCVELQSGPEAAKKRAPRTVLTIYPANAAPKVETLLKNLQAAVANQ